MKKLFIFAVILYCCSCNSSKNSISYNRQIVDTLTAPHFWGRGYTKDGMKNAADYLAAQFKKLGLSPLDNEDYLQRFYFPINTFPGKMNVSVNGKQLIPGVDFIVGAESRGVSIDADLKQTDSTHFMNSKNHILVSLEKKLTWDAEQEQVEHTRIQLDKNRFTEIPRSIKLDIENTFIENFEAANVCAMVPGKEQPDSFIFITAHYDHLGGMGSDTYFPGANDNASGTALLLSLAKYYSKHPQKYSIGFILFAAEEAGLVGSKYFTENPLVPLDHIRFLTNTDLAGTGSDGITVVNATLFPKEFALMKSINDKHKYLVDIGQRGKAANSDHYWFTEKGVPAFFFYTKGGIPAYHDVFDKGATLPLTKQADLKKLLIEFNEGLQKGL